MSLYLLPNELIFYIATFLNFKEQITVSRTTKRLHEALQLNLSDNQKAVDWSCTYWVKEEQKTPVLAIIYPNGQYQQAKEHLNVLPSITTPGHIIYHTKKQKLIEHTQKLGTNINLFQARNRRCYLKIIKKRAALHIEAINMERIKSPSSLIQDAVILYP